MRRVATTVLGVMLLACCAVGARAAQYPPGPLGTCNPPTAWPGTVKPIQDITNPCFPGIRDTVYGIGGVVTGFDKIPTGFAFYIQNNGSGVNGVPFSGIDVFTEGVNLAANLGLVIGDSVVVDTSRTDDFGGGSEIRSPNLSFTTPNIVVRKIAGPSAAHPVPPYHVGTVNELQELPTNTPAEQWEGCLVKVNGPMRVVRTSAQPPGIGTGNSFLVVDNIICPTGSVGPCDSLFIDGNTLTTYAPPANGILVDQVQGIYDQRTRGYRIQLRDGNDIIVATPPNVTDAYPVADDTIRVTFDRAVTAASAQNTANYSFGSLRTVISATREANGTAVNIKVGPALRSNLPEADGDNESITVNHIAGQANGLAMIAAQSLPFIDGVLTITAMQTPDPSALISNPCSDRSRFAGVGQAPGTRLSFRGVVVKQFGTLFYMSDPGATKAKPRSGISMFAPIATMIEGHQYLVAGAVQEFFEETEATSNAYLRDEGAVTADKMPFPQDKLISTVAQMSDTTCDAGGDSGPDHLGNIANAEDFEGALVKLHAVKVVAFNTDPTDPAPGGSFRVAGPYPTYGDTILISDQDNSYTYDPVPGHIVDVAGVLRFPFSAFRIYPRDNSDIKDYGTSGVPGDIPGEVSFSVFPNPARVQRVSFGLPKADNVDIGVYDISGRKLATLASGSYPAGNHSTAWNGLDSKGNVVGTGMFFYRMRLTGETRVARAIKLK